MKNYIDDTFVSKAGILLIHGLNPYGFKYTRRVTENNVDLNRNCDTDMALYNSDNKGYTMIYDLLNPNEKLERFSMSNKFFFSKAIRKIAEKGMPVLRQAALQGQYQYEKGLYFGGKKPEPQIEKVQKIIKEVGNPYEVIFAVDLHTGYGERGKMHLFPNPVEDNMKKRMEAIFDKFQIDWGDSDDFYTVTGDFVGFIGKVHSSKIFIPMVFEFGTMNSQTTIGSLKSIHTMIMENQGFHKGYTTSEDSITIKKEIREMYYPSSKEWRSRCVNEFKTVLDVALPRFFMTEF